MGQGREKAVHAFFSPGIIDGVMEQSPCGLFRLGRLFRDIQHVKFRADVGAFGMRAHGELSPPCIEFQNRVCDNQVPPDTLARGRLPHQQPQAKHKFILLAKSE